ncbi:endonuclease/exonuclease/phosphatase family protein [uncultured Metabacillus sp.]|uniref:endonuclease/exonuclease/phosphatase family protein n=1 Tax=uncultured Metabacillus sp. TaxID=2860135 RepID=UPI00260509E5|nr:endonuclease/exonuclease/phosphatase family protein [uncultured Metabacillus sp.]
MTVEIANQPQLRVLTFNIHHGEGNDGIIDLNRIAAIINNVKPDLVAIQEVDKNVKRTENVDQPDLLGQLTGMNVAFGKAVDFDGGEYGQALLYRFPLDSFETISLPNPANNEQRVALVGKFVPENDLPPFTFIGTHLEFESKECQIAQAEKLKNQFGTTTPLILAGDLNATPQSAAIDILRTNWDDATAKITEPTCEEDGKIDYIMYGGRNQWRVISTQALDNRRASDHKPVFAVLSWRGE